MIIPETNKYLILFTALLILMIPFAAPSARIVHVAVDGSDSGDGSINAPYASVQKAIKEICDWHPENWSNGDTIFVHEGTYSNEPAGGGYPVYGKYGTYVYIMGVPGEAKPVFNNDDTAGFTSVTSGNTPPHNFALKRLIYQKASLGAHNLNISAWEVGDYPGPIDEGYVHNVIVDSCEFHNERENAEMIKMAGVDSFVISNCYFSASNEHVIGIAGVGCHVGEIYNNTIDSCLQGGIQFKGGSSAIVIRNNIVNMCAFTGINMGGDTGSDYFRPPLVAMETPHYEAKEIDCYSNVVIDCPVPFSFNTSRDCRFYNNMVITTDSTRTSEGLYASVGVVWVRHTSNAVPGPSRDNIIANNIFYYNEVRSGYKNIFFQYPENSGGDDDLYASSFKFYNNLWYCFENPSESWKDWTNGGRWNTVDTLRNIFAEDPDLIVDPSSGIRFPTNGELLVWQGTSITPPDGYEYRDFFGEMYTNPPPIGPINITSEPGAPPSVPLMNKLMPANLNGKQE